MLGRSCMTDYLFQRQKEDLHKRIIQLEKQLDAKQAIELEIEQLRGSLNVMSTSEMMVIWKFLKS